MLSEEGILVHAQQCFPKLAEREDSPRQQRYRLHPTPSKPESLAATLESSPPPRPFTKASPCDSDDQLGWFAKCWYRKTIKWDVFKSWLALACSK